MTPPDLLARASDELRDRSRPRADEIAGGILRSVLRSRRRSLPVRANPPYAYLHVSEFFIVAMLRERIGASADTAAVRSVRLTIDRDLALREVDLELIVQQGEVLLERASSVHETIKHTLDELLGPPPATGPEVATRVHVSDISAGSPHVTDPS